MVVLLVVARVRGQPRGFGRLEAVEPDG